MPTFSDFQQFDIRVGTIVKAEEFLQARRPAYKLWVDFGPTIGLKQSSAQITNCYQLADLINKQVLGVVNFPPMKIAGFSSEVLILGTYSQPGVILITPDQPAQNGDRLG